MAGELHLELDVVRDLVALEDDIGRPVRITVDRPLHPANQRLMDALGVEVRVVSATKPRTGATPERLELARRCRELRNQGLLQREIAGELGIRRGWVNELLSDPDGSKARARKDSYAGECVDCGGPVSGSEGRTARPSRCERCALARQHEERYWTRETIVEAFRRFAEVVGRTPTAVDQLIRNPSVRSRLSPERIADGERAEAIAGRLPHPEIVRREFGSWRAGVEAAGLTPAPTGGLGHRAPRRNTRKGANLARIYHVLHRNGDGGLHEQQIEAYSPENAIEKVADGAGEWIAVLDSNWFTASTEARQVFAVVKS